MKSIYFYFGPPVWPSILFLAWGYKYHDRFLASMALRCDVKPLNFVAFVLNILTKVVSMPFLQCVRASLTP